MSDRFFFAFAVALSIVSLTPNAFAANINAASPYKFGSPEYIQEWNKRFETRQHLLNGPVAVTPKYGYAPHVPQAVIKGNQCGDYFSEEISHGAMRWDHSPLRVCIAAGGAGYQRSYGAIFTEALKEWTKASGGRISFVQVSDPSESDITVDWIAGTPGAGEAGNTQSAFRSMYGQRILTHAHIDLAGIVGGKPMSDSEMKKTCLHELGHALGLVHTSGSGDIMYWQSNPAQACALGPRDSATIQRLYSIQ